MEPLQKELLCSNHENIYDCKTFLAFILERKNVLLARESKLHCIELLLGYNYTASF